MTSTNPEIQEVSDEAWAEKFAESLSDESPGDADTEENESEIDPEPDDDEEEDADKTEPRRFRVKVDGNEVDVDEAELLSGYQRHADYTKKTQAVAEKSKSVDQERAYIAQLRTHHLQALEQIHAKLQAPEVDLEALYNEDPLAYMREVVSSQKRQAQQAAVQQEHARLTQQQSAEQEIQFEAYLGQQSEELAKLVPDYRDDAKRSEFTGRVRTYAKTLGYSDDELSHATDYRAIVVLDKARRFDEISARAAKVKQSAPSPTARPGSSAPAPNKAKAASARFKTSQRPDDFAAAMEQFIK